MRELEGSRGTHRLIQTNRHTCTYRHIKAIVLSKIDRHTNSQTDKDTYTHKETDRERP